MIRIPQHIKRECSPEEFGMILNGEKLFHLTLNNFPIDAGDLITFVENDGTKSGRVITKKVMSVQRTEDLEVLPEEEGRYGFLVLGLQNPEVNTLRSLFRGYFAMAFVLEKEAEFSWQTLQGPTYWPQLICPNLETSGIMSNLKLHKWPEGIYSVHLRIQPEVEALDKPISISIVDAFILLMVELEGELVGVEIDPTNLLLGKTITVYEEEEIAPSPPERVKELLRTRPKISSGEDNQLVARIGKLSDQEFQEIVDSDGVHKRTL